MNDFHDLCLLLRSRFPILSVDTQEAARLLTLRERACNPEQWPLYRWSVADGLRPQAGAPEDPAQQGPETRELETALLREELARTRPRSVVMAERVAALRAWAATRTVPAD